MNKSILAGMGILILVILACGVGTSTPQVNSVSTVVASTLQAYTQAAPSGIPLSFQNTGFTVSFIIPEGLASGASSKVIPAASAEQVGEFSAAPEFTQLTLNDYKSSGSFGMLQINIYPAQEYARVNTYASECMDRLQAVLADKSFATQPYPGIPFILGGGPLFMAQTKLMNFNNGMGVSAITEYGELPGQVTNQGVFYNFQGLTSDGKYYIVAVLPIGVPYLAYDSNATPPQPADAVPFPTGDNLDSGVYDDYYKAVTEKLNTTDANIFEPSLNQLDNLFQSITVK